jgi:hypothetical protein
VKALPALLCLLLIGIAPAWAADPAAPQTLPIIYDQPGEKYILRIDNRRYQLPYVTKEGIVRLMSAANYPRTKLRYEEFKRALEDKAKAVVLVNRAQSAATREADRVTNIARTIPGVQRVVRVFEDISEQELRGLRPAKSEPAPAPAKPKA